MERDHRGSSALEAEEYLLSAHRTCAGFELMVVTSAAPRARRDLRESLQRAGADVEVVAPSADVVGEPRVVADDGEPTSFVYWIEAEHDAGLESWREFAVALNRARERLRDQYRYLWVLAGPLSLRQIMTLHAQDIYSGAYKAPHVTAHPDASLTWLHLSDLQLGASGERAIRQGGDVWRNIDELLLPDLHRSLDAFDAAPDLVLVSGDLGARGRPEDYDDVGRFTEQLLDELERRNGARPVLLAVPGNHDVLRPVDPVERWRFMVLEHYGADDPLAESLREHLWQRNDPALLEPLFAGYQQWMQRWVFDALDPDELGLEAGRTYVRSVTRSHVPGDWSIVVEKDDFRLGLVGLNTAWTSLDDEVSEGILPFEQFRAAVGARGRARLEKDMHQCLLLTHHGPGELSSPSSVDLARQIQPMAEFAAHVCGPHHERSRDVASGGGPPLLSGYPLFAWGIAPRGPSSGYRLGRIRRDGHVDSFRRVLEPIPARGSWRYVDDRGSSKDRPEVESDPSTLEPELAHYIAKLEALHRELPLAGFETKVRVAIDLDDLYVPLDAVVDRAARWKAVGSASEAEALHGALAARGHEFPLVEAFAAARRLGRRGVVLLGDPGSGKTTHLEQLLLKIIRHGAESVGLPVGTVPVFLPLRRLRDSEGGLEGFIHEALRDPMLGLAEDFGARLVRHGRLLYLLDGLDEVASSESQRQVSRWIEDLRRTQPDCYFLVSSRFSGYSLDARLDEGFMELHLRPMNAVQVESFVRRWYRLVEGALTEDSEQAAVRAERMAEDLLETLRRPEMSSTRVYTMTGNPLLLTMICLVHRDRGELPTRRASLYYEATQVLLERWRSVTKELRVTFSAREARLVLQPVAEWMHQQPGRIRATAAELDEVVSEGLRMIERDMSAREFLETIRDESGLLTGWGLDEYGFMHLGFQEYLAARELRSRGFGDKGVLRELVGRFGESWWQEVILLMLAQDEPAIFKPFMRVLVERPEFPQWASSSMMQLCLDEACGVSEEPFVTLLNERTGDETLEARQLAAVKLLATRLPQALEGLEDVLREHPAAGVCSWWRAREREQGLR